MPFQRVQVSLPSNFISIFSTIKYNSSVPLLTQTYTLVKSSSLKFKFLRFSSARVKICQISHINFELTSQVLFSFASFFILMTHNFPVNFKLIRFLFWIKGPSTSPSFQTFELALVKICQILCHFRKYKPVFLQILHQSAVQ